MTRLWLRAFVVGLVMPAAFYAGVRGETTTAAVDFDLEIRPILTNHCFRCHGPDRESRVSDRRLDSREALIAELDGLRAVVPGKPDESELIRRVLSDDPADHMPPPDTQTRLTSGQIEKLRRWIRQGASWSRLWSLRPLSRAMPPGVRDKAWPINSIDRFVLRRLERQSMSPSVAADRFLVMRRVTLDLTGLPPRRDDVRRFLDDDRPEAYARLVDRLLASPQYGERWARPWLDLARYSDTTADWLKGIGQAWLYRDWVIRSLNGDLPYDQFAQMQLAADTHPEAATQDQAALGFLGLSPTYWKELRLAPDVIKRIVADEWDERLDAVTRTFLGLTVSCARCHDHKFDPITTEDYYALAGVFASTQLADHPLLPAHDAARLKEVRKQLEQLQSKLSAASQGESQTLRKTIDELEQQVNRAVWAHAVEDSSIYVLPEGQDRTKLEYRLGESRDLPVYRRGNPANPGPLVPRRFLSALSEGEPSHLSRGSGRADLADAIFTRRARRLAARVIVNRVWEQHFGQGLVRTPSNFGSQGEPPSHPDLLDWLAAELIRNDWSLKGLHRKIVLSATYRQASLHRDAAYQLDPENRLLWRMNRRRMGVEMWRDTLLSVSNQLDLRMGGPALALDDSSNNRRTIYGRIARRDVNRFLRLYDFPEPTSHSPKREPTITPLQQLFVLNSQFFDTLAESVATELLKMPNDTRRIDFCYARLLARHPSPNERVLALRFVQSAESSTTAHVAWRDYVHALLALNELMFLE